MTPSNGFTTHYDKRASLHFTLNRDTNDVPPTSEVNEDDIPCPPVPPHVLEGEILAAVYFEKDGGKRGRRPKFIPSQDMQKFPICEIHGQQS